MYEMLTGAKVFPRATPMAAALAQVSDPPPALPQAVAAPVARVVARLLAKDPSQRYPSAGEVAAALEAPGSAPPPVPSSRRRALVGAGAALAAIGLAAAFVVRGPARGARRERAVAVLPFASASESADDAWLADAVFDDLLGRLALVGDLTVMSRASVTPYRQGARDVREIADALGVREVIEGSVRRSGARVTIEARLVDAREDRVTWSARYERDRADLPGIQATLAEEVIHALHGHTSPAEKARIERKPTENAEAYDYYLRGHEYDRRPNRRPEDWDTAEKMYRSSIALDPAFALAHARLAMLHARIAWWRLETSAERLGQARAEAQRALALDPDLPESHLAVGWDHYARREYGPALDEFKLAHDMAPSDTHALRDIANVQRRLGRFDESVATVAQVLRLDPHSSEALFQQGVTLMWLRDYAQADSVLERALSWAPDNVPIRVQLAFVALLARGDAAPGKALIARLPTLSGGPLTEDMGFLELFKVLPGEAAAVLAPLPYDVIANRIESYPKALVLGLGAAVRGDETGAKADYELARGFLEGQVQEHPADSGWHIALAQADAQLGRSDEARREVQTSLELLPVSRDAFDGTALLIDAAAIHARIGDVDLAVRELQMLLAMPSPTSRELLRIDPRFAALRDDPRFGELDGAPAKTAPR
jgi:TolB-like protein/Flp pilus assembly protein TadD